MNWKKVNTLQKFAEYINTDYAFAYKVDAIIERNGWNKLFGMEICSYNGEKLVFIDNNNVGILPV